MAATSAGSATTLIGHTGYSPQDTVTGSPSARRGELPAGVNGSAAVLLEHVVRRGTTTLAELADVLVERYGLGPDQALADVAVFVRDGQTAGALSFHATLGRRVHARLRYVGDVLMFPVRGGIIAPSVQRQYYPFSVARMVLSAVHAQVLVGLAIVALCAIGLSFLDGFWSGAGAEFMAGFATGVIGGLVVLGTLHEAAHAALSSAWGSRPVAVYRQGMRIGLQRTRLTPLRDLLISVVGPSAGVAVGALLLAALLEVDRTAPSTLARAAMIGLLVATSIQAACLVPPAADGNVVLASWRRHRTARRAARART